jgi:cytochrome c peroxidase
MKLSAANPGSIRNRAPGLVCKPAAVLAAAILGLVAPGAQAVNLAVETLPRFNGAPLLFDAITNRTAAGQLISVTRLDYLVSNFALRRADGAWLGLTNWQAYISAREGRMRFELPGLPAGRYDTVRFLVGVTPEVNRGNPAQYGPEHPLNPTVNGLHWGWQGGYVFLALEGDWHTTNGDSGYSFHVANDPQLMSVELPVDMDMNGDSVLHLALDVARIFDARRQIALAESNSTSHSRTNDALGGLLHDNIEHAFSVQSFAPAMARPAARPAVAALMASNATPYRFTFSAVFPQPALPLDNPLTEEGVELGRRLFFDPRLSINENQSCASCHDLKAAGADKGRAFSIGAEGKTGSRNAMPLFNLAWKNSFFWDGRAASVREQVLQPIQNPIEMHETLSNIVAKLSRPDAPASTNYASLFARAFGTAEINSDRVARALEQFMLIQVSHNSKFDRMLAGQEQFTEEEQRGFMLFHTEYDPRREQYGADCFHCHGGPLFQNVAFANNGLDAEFKDMGRYEVTHREGDQGKFAVPSLRNVAITGPYMHDGRFQTLEQVVEHYSSGVKRTATLDPNLAKHPAGGVPLSEADKKALVAFLKTLTDDQYQDLMAAVTGPK